MHPDNETCVQRARFFFHFFEKKDWLPGERPPLDDIVKKKNLRPEAIRNLNKFLTTRLDRIAKMMELLLEVHDDWAVTGKKDMVLMETETFDFNKALEVLKQNGFHDDEFILKVEYTRKWGVL
ncbi:hypothetical protein [Dehalobacterium formicoaceticum]|uniref:Uncharacterized protein n=1 Tax=Dehalobacterium formicoaceticum TaxID=51515 RepID=A0ABT1Y5A8_9FIRM|nr:hypothetical protein [Dehalobacterium formicoaceticum]MCR6546059.1 hypothetical protein [Dehalobacterium formicoaceticum]